MYDICILELPIVLKGQGKQRAEILLSKEKFDFEVNRALFRFALLSSYYALSQSISFIYITVVPYYTT